MRIRTLAAKAAQMLLLFLLLVVLVFFLSRLAPGDPLRAYYGQSVERMSPSARAAAEQKLGLDQPLTAQFVIWVKNALSGDFGISFQYKQDVLTVVGGRWQNTLVLGSSPSCTLNTAMSSSARKNTGIHESAAPSRQSRRSTKLPAWEAQ